MIITDPADVQLSFLNSLRGVEALVDLLGGNPANVVNYEEARNGDLLATIDDLEPPSVLLYFDGVDRAYNPSLNTYLFGLAVRATNPTAIYARICDGVSTASGTDGRPLLVSTIHFGFLPMIIPTMKRRFIQVGEHAVFDYWEIVTGFTDKKSF